MKFIIKKPYIYLFLTSLLIYLALLYFLSDFEKTILLALQYSETVSWTKLSFSILISLLIGFFIAINICYVVKEYKLRKNCKKGSTLTSAGVIAGLAVGVCPLCVGGLLPLVLGILGVSFSFGVLPWQGVEVQLIVLAMMIFTTYTFHKKKYLR